MQRAIPLIFILLFFYACGGGSTTKESLPLKRLYLIDAPINGVDYECGIRKFTTHSYENREGVALCRHSPVVFKLGSLLLGQIDEIQNNQEIYPQDLVGVSRDNFDDDERVIKLSLLLQSLDNDGEIHHTIDIEQKIKDNIEITSLKNLTLEDIRSLIKKVGKKPLSLDNVNKHLREHSGIVSIEDIEVNLKDTTAVGTTIALLNMTNSQNISKIEILKGEGKEFFVIENSGAVKLAKALDYKLKRSYTFQIQATNPIGKSNIANLNINVESGSSEDLSFIDRPLLKKSILYTNSNRYNIEISGRADTQIYIDNISTGQTMPSTGSITLTRYINGADRSESHTITLRYPNGIESEPTPYTIVKDTKAPNIMTPSIIDVQENSSIVTNFQIEDSNKDKGLDYTLSGQDAPFFKVSNVGEIAFELPADFEIPRDYNADNIYDIVLTVEDKAHNASSKEFHIVLKDILDSKPVILPFTKEISRNTPAGTTIGRLNIDAKDSPISSLTLEGNGSQNFQLNSDGTIQLMSKIDATKIFTLTATATNKFGISSAPVLIYIREEELFGKLHVGIQPPETTITLLELHRDTQIEPISVSKLNVNYTFPLNTNLLKNDSFYIYQLSTNPLSYEAEKRVLFRAIVKGSWIKQNNKTIRISAVSEMLYCYVAKYIKSTNSVNYYGKLENKMNEYSKLLLSKDLNNDLVIDAKDILVYNPNEDSNALYRTLLDKEKYEKIVKKMEDGNITYIDDLFQTRVLKTFEDADAFEQVNRFAYYFESKTGRVYIYDTANKREVSELFLELPNNIILNESDPSDDFVDDVLNQLLQKNNSYRASVKVNILQGRLYISNFNDKTFIVDISNLKEPKLLNSINSGHGARVILDDPYLLIDTPSSNLEVGDEINSSTVIYDITNVNDIKKKEYTLPAFQKIQNGKTYYFDTSKCEESNEITVRTSQLSDDINNRGITKNFTIYSSSCLEKAFFDHDRIFVYDGTYLEIYTIEEESLNYASIIYLDATKIVDIVGDTLYTYNQEVLDNSEFNSISLVDVSDIENPFIQKTTPFHLISTAIEGTVLFNDNIPLSIKDGYFNTHNQLIDLKSFLASAQYTDGEEGIDYSLFEKLE